MTAYLPGYRLTLYAPRSVDASEATILTPPGGAVHSDLFKVTTFPALSGWKPYLGLPRGRTGRVDVLERKTDIGTMAFDVGDVALVPGVNANRWVSAFLGNAQGDPQLGGLKCYAEESLDGGTTWLAFWTGYVKALALNGLGQYTLTVRDLTHELTKLPLFRQPPHASVTYAARPLVLPLGLAGASYGTLPVAADLTGHINSPIVVGGSTLANVAGFALDTPAVQRKDNFVTRDLLANISPGTRVWTSYISYSSVPTFQGALRCHLSWNGGANQGDFKVGALFQTNYGGFSGMAGQLNPGGHAAVTGLLLAPLDDPADLNYAALPANATVVTGRCFIDYQGAAGLMGLVDVANPLTMLADILAGKFGPLYRWPDTLPPGKVYGDVRRTFATTVSAANQPELPPARFLLDQPVENALDWVQANLLKPYGLALVCDGAGVFSVVDLRLPTSLSGVPTLTDADVVTTATAPAWEYDRDSAIFRADGVLWEDVAQPLDGLRALPDATPDLRAAFFTSYAHPIVTLAIGGGDFGEKGWQLGGTGYRLMPGDAAVQNRTREAYLYQKMLEQMNLIRRPYAHGATTITLHCRRTATVAALVQGQVIQVATSSLPNPATGKRGGTRVARITEITRAGLETDIRLLDLGVASVALVPALSGLALGSDPRHTATITLTLNAAGQPAEVRYALTNGGAIPADTSAAWHAYPSNPVTATGVLTLTGLTPGMRLWVQARTNPHDRAALALPSAWVSSGSLDLTAYAAPSAVSVTAITATSARVSWTNGDVTLPVEVWLRSPDSGAYTRVALLLPGSTFFSLWGLAASTAYGVSVNYRSFLGGVVSPSATAAFSTTGALPIPIMPPPPLRVYT